MIRYTIFGLIIMFLAIFGIFFISE